MAFRSKTSRTSRLMIETLEGREVPASLVVGTVVGGVLTLTGDDQANAFVLKDTGDDMVVTAVDAGTTIQGLLPAGPTQTFLGVTAVKLVLKGGDDVVSLDATGTLTLAGAFTADMGDGDNTLNLANGVAAVAASVGSLDYKGQDGVDTVIVGAANHTTAVAGKVTISAGDAANGVTLTNTTVAGDFSFTGGVGRDTLTFGAGTVLAKNLTAAFGTSSDPDFVIMGGGSVTGNVSLKGAGGQIYFSPLAATMVSGTTGVTIDGGASGSSFIQMQGNLSIPNGGVALTGTNGGSAVQSLNMFSLTAAKDVKVSNRYASISTGGLSAKNVTVTGVDAADVSVSGAGTTAAAVKVTSSAGNATATFGGAATAVTGAVTVSGPAGAYVTDEAAGVATFGSTITATAARGDAGFNQERDSTLTITGAVTVKAFDVAYLFLKGGNEKKLLKDVRLTSAIDLAVVTVDNGKTTFGGNLTAKGVSTDVTLEADAPGSSVAKNLTVTGGLDSDDLSWRGGFNVLGNATFNLSAGNTDLDIGGGGTVTEVNNLSVTTTAGTDKIFIANFKANGNVAIKTGAGADRVEIARSTFMTTFTLDTGDGDDTLSIARVDSSNAPVTFTGKATIKLGADNDTLELGTPGADLDKAVFNTAGSTIDGGLGYNLFDDDLGQGLVTTNLTLGGLFADPTP